MNNNYDDMELELEGQIPEYVEPEITNNAQQPQQPRQQVQQEQMKEQPQQQSPYESGSMIGKKINVGPNMNMIDKDKANEFVNKHHLSKVGDSIAVNADIREGWMEVDKALLGERAIFYPESWEFRIRPATVEAIRNWSTIDDENVSSIDRVFNEILKSCFSIITPNGPTPWYNINAWDRFFFVLLIREYTFKQGEQIIQYTEDCTNCDNPVTFQLTSNSLMFDLPDPEVMPMYDRANRIWIIDPQEYGLPMEEPIKLWVPTLEKDINIKQWATNRYQENPNRDLDPVLIRFMPWFMQKISKDDTIAQRQIKEFKRRFETWDIDTFKFMDDVITNVIVTPSTKLIRKCPVCGEEVSSLIRFPNGASSLFNVSGKYGKFGKK